MEFQTRSEDTGLMLHETLAKALEEAKADRTIWKISFSLPNKERIRLVKVVHITGPYWKLESIHPRIKGV